MQIDIGMDWEVDLNPIALRNRNSIQWSCIMKKQYEQWSGKESFHLFMDESNSVTTRSSHWPPIRPVKSLDFLLEYNVRNVKASISQSRKWTLNAVTLDGFPGGCFQLCSGSSHSQYSSSTSIGRSASKLKNQWVRIREEVGSDTLFILYCTGSTNKWTCQPIIGDKTPKTKNGWVQVEVAHCLYTRNIASRVHWLQWVFDRPSVDVLHAPEQI